MKKKERLANPSGVLVRPLSEVYCLKSASAGLFLVPLKKSNRHSNKTTETERRKRKKRTMMILHPSPQLFPRPSASPPQSPITATTPIPFPN